MTPNVKQSFGFIKQYQDWRYWYVGGGETALNVGLALAHQAP
jgi:hypothetical protein